MSKENKEVEPNITKGDITKKEQTRNEIVTNNIASNEKVSGEKINNKIVIASIVFAFICILAAGSVFLFTLYQDKQDMDVMLDDTEELDDTRVEEFNDYTMIRYNGDVYNYNDNITTILFLGIDQTEDSLNGGSEGRSDAIILLLVDEETKEVTMLNISRDTITEVDIVNTYGERISSADMHLALQFSYGDGGSRSCLLSCNAVSELLYGIPIDYYLAMNMDDLDLVVDMLGGLDLTMVEDYSMIDESYTEGSTIHMTGEMVTLFVRYRDITILGSNDQRMARQELFLQEFVKILQTKASEDKNELISIWESMTQYIDTNLNLDTIESLVTYDLNKTSYKVPGETIEGDLHDEYIVDEDLLVEIIVQLLYKLK